MHSERSEGGDVPTCSELTGERGDKLSFCCNDCQRLIYFGAWKDELETAASFPFTGARRAKYMCPAVPLKPLHIHMKRCLSAYRSCLDKSRLAQNTES